MILQPNQAGAKPKKAAVKPKGDEEKEKRAYAPNVQPEQYWDSYFHADGTQNFDKKAAGSVPVGSPVPLAYMLPKHPEIGVKHQWILEREKNQAIAEPFVNTVDPLVFPCSFGSGRFGGNNEPEPAESFGQSS